MTFEEIQDAVLSDRFGESKRADAKRWINHRYGRMWAQEPWNFKISVASYSLAQNATTASLGSFQRVIAVFDDTISPLYRPVEAMRPADFYSWATRSAGIPVGFTVIGDNIRFDAPASSARTYTVIGELEFTELVNDSDVPLIPAEFHQTLVHGAISEGLRLENDPTWQAAEEDFRAGVEDMKKGYLTPVRNFVSAYPAWP